MIKLTAFRVLRLCRRQTVSMMIGPPSSSGLDEIMVREFLETEGEKIVCGGTTNRIGAAALAVFAVVLAARAAACRPSGEHYGPREDIQVDGEGAVQRLAQLVRIPTVSDYDEAKVDEAQFEKFREKLKELYPAVHEACPPVLCRGEGRTTGLLFRWKGASSAEPTVLMAHYDVVPVEEHRICPYIFLKVRYNLLRPLVMKRKE